METNVNPLTVEERVVNALVTPVPPQSSLTVEQTSKTSKWNFLSFRLCVEVMMIVTYAAGILTLIGWLMNLNATTQISLGQNMWIVVDPFRVYFGQFYPRFLELSYLSESVDAMTSLIQNVSQTAISTVRELQSTVLITIPSSSESNSNFKLMVFVIIALTLLRLLAATVLVDLIRQAHLSSKRAVSDHANSVYGMNQSQVLLRAFRTLAIIRYLAVLMPTLTDAVMVFYTLQLATGTELSPTPTSIAMASFILSIISTVVMIAMRKASKLAYLSIWRTVLWLFVRLYPFDFGFHLMYYVFLAVEDVALLTTALFKWLDLPRLRQSFRAIRNTLGVIRGIGLEGKFALPKTSVLTYPSEMGIVSFLASPNPSCRVGSGFIIKSQGKFFLYTAYHVGEASTHVQWATDKPISLDQYPRIVYSEQYDQMIYALPDNMNATWFTKARLDYSANTEFSSFQLSRTTPFHPTRVPRNRELMRAYGAYDSESGDSGSPVFQSGSVVGIHIGCDDHANIFTELLCPHFIPTFGIDGVAISGPVIRASIVAEKKKGKNKRRAANIRNSEQYDNSRDIDEIMAGYESDSEEQTVSSRFQADALNGLFGNDGTSEHTVYFHDKAKAEIRALLMTRDDGRYNFSDVMNMDDGDLYRKACEIVTNHEYGYSERKPRNMIDYSSRRFQDAYESVRTQRPYGYYAENDYYRERSMLVDSFATYYYVDAGNRIMYFVLSIGGKLHLYHLAERVEMPARPVSLNIESSPVSPVPEIDGLVATGKTRFKAFLSKDLPVVDKESFPEIIRDECSKFVSHNSAGSVDSWRSQMRYRMAPEYYRYKCHRASEGLTIDPELVVDMVTAIGLPPRRPRVVPTVFNRRLSYVDRVRVHMSCMVINRKSSPGYPWSERKPTRGDVLDDESMREEVIQSAGRILEAIFENTVDGLEIYIKVFIKAEYHELRKAMEGRWRTISCPPIDLSIVADMLLVDLSYLKDHTTTTRAIKIGVTVDYPSVRRQYDILQESLGGDDEVVAVCVDASSWDMMFREYMWHACEEFAVQVLTRTFPALDSRRDELRTVYRNLTNVHINATFVLPAVDPLTDRVETYGYRFTEKSRGIMLSGFQGTSLYNSIANYYICSAAAGEPVSDSWFMGDDSVVVIPLDRVEHFMELLRQSGHRYSQDPTISHMGQPVDFCSRIFSRETTYLTRWAKGLFKLISNLRTLCISENNVFDCVLAKEFIAQWVEGNLLNPNFSDMRKALIDQFKDYPVRPLVQSAVSKYSTLAREAFPHA